MAARLLAVLARVVELGWDVLAGAGVTFDRRNYREPDIAVVRSAALAGAQLSASDVLLALEVMSPSSIANDRVARRSTPLPGSRTSGASSRSRRD